jgi:hypothetical protein
VSKYPHGLPKGLTVEEAAEWCYQVRGGPASTWLYVIEQVAEHVRGIRAITEATMLGIYGINPMADAAITVDGYSDDNEVVTYNLTFLCLSTDPREVMIDITDLED